MELIARHREREERIRLDRKDDGSYSVTVGERSYEIDVAAAGRLLSLRVIDGEQLEVAVRPTGQRGRATYEVSSHRGLDVVELLDPLAHLAEQARGDAGGNGRVEALMPGQVVEILIAEGEAVEKGQGVLVLEAMKMKNEIQAESSGTLARLFVQERQNVEGGDPLFEVE